MYRVNTNIHISRKWSKAVTFNIAKWSPWGATFDEFNPFHQAHHPWIDRLTSQVIFNINLAYEEHLINSDSQSLISWEISFQWAQPWMLVPFAGLDLQEVGPVKIDFNRQSWFDFHIAFMNMGITPIYGQIFSVKGITVKIKIKNRSLVLKYTLSSFLYASPPFFAF